MSSCAYVWGWLEFYGQRAEAERIIREGDADGWTFPEGDWLDAACYARAVRSQHSSAEPRTTADARGTKGRGVRAAREDWHRAVCMPRARQRCGTARQDPEQPVITPHVRAISVPLGLVTSSGVVYELIFA